ncbi:MAG: hypothetical protein IPP66_17130 [Anaerolineales bacterium]|nr:hypothetical protein [Anaerolineales bacterium]
MENLTIGNIAVATVIVGILDLVIVVLVRTETILKAVERIKGVIQLDYKSRAKRSEDEIRISKKHELVAKERVRSSFVIMNLWDCKWTWNWSKDFEPINIKGFCIGDSEYDRILGKTYRIECDQPVNPYYLFPQQDADDKVKNEYEKSTMGTLAIVCSNSSTYIHKPYRAKFEILKSTISKQNSTVTFDEYISKAILSERDLRVAKEIQKLNWQFWK